MGGGERGMLAVKAHTHTQTHRYKIKQIQLTVKLRQTTGAFVSYGTLVK